MEFPSGFSYILAFRFPKQLGQQQRSMLNSPNRAPTADYVSSILARMWKMMHQISPNLPGHPCDLGGCPYNLL